MKIRNEVQAGIFLVSALLLFIAGIWLLSQERQLFSSQEKYYSTFRDVKGLAEGAPIHIGGITVGRVDKIGFSEDKDDPDIHVTMLIGDKYLERIRSDAGVTIETLGLLGDRYLSIKGGQNPQPLTTGSTIPSREPTDIADVLAKAGIVVDNTVKISESINQFAGSFHPDVTTNLKQTTESFADILKSIQHGNGLVHRIIYSDKEGAAVLKNLEKLTANVREITQEMRLGDGLLHGLIYEKEGAATVKALTTAALNLSTTAERVSELAGDIKTGDGLLHDLVYTKSPKGLEEIIAKLHAAAANIELASKALAQGSGTIGALLMDSKVYDNLVEVTDEAKRSFILRQAIKSSLKK